MDDLISRQNAIRIAEQGQIQGFEWQIKKLLGMPSAEPEIIRCKDCKYWTHIKRTNRYWCKTDDGLFDLNTSPDDFCSRAERKEE